MKTKILGETGLVITPIGLGLAALGRPGYITLKHADDLDHVYSSEEMEQHVHTVLDAAWKAGIRYFDAARSYGRAEAFLASWLAKRQISPREVTVGSKWGYTYTADWKVGAEVNEIKDHSLAQLRRQRRESVEILGRYLYLYQIHSATLESGVLEDQSILDELANYQEQGLKIGLTLSGPKQSDTLYRALKITRRGRPLFDCVQATWNLFETSVGQALMTAHQRGMGVLVKEALANGRLTDKNDDLADSEKIELLREVAAEQLTTVDAIALAAVLAQPWADIVLSGAATTAQLVSNVAATSVVWNNNLQKRLAVMAELPEDYWKKRSSLSWN
ncbi:MAG TPA: aldo/keto reductase [Anaerolineaceae bacterium]|nr:aldo/keto reductase [Anaerolineaceae bacterium]